MKINKLTIHNIASIEDAEIDFTQAPLSNSDVFLITGNTGSGKSTILDAITLAIYGTTPRMETTEMKGKINDGDKEMGINDVRQLLRRGTGEGTVELDFIGSNNIHYNAKWSIKRARNKIDGKLQNVARELEDLDNDKKYNKSRDIDDEIVKAIGLDFNQFCRTTMLAQGQFTKFLNSGDNEKSAILEKITGNDIFTRIGKKVSEKFSDANRQYNDALKDMENVILMSEEEVAKMNSEKTELDTVSATLKKQQDELCIKKLWLERREELTLNLTNANKEKEEAEDKLKNEEYILNEQTVQQWETSETARNAYKERKEQEVKLSSCKEKLEESRRNLARCKGGELWLNEEKIKIEKRIAELKKSLDDETANEDLFQQADTICNNIKQYLNKHSQKSDKEKDIKIKEEEINKTLQPQYKACQENTTKVSETLEEQKSVCNKLKTDLDKCGLSDLRESENKAKEEHNKIINAQNALNQLRQNEERHQKDIEEQKGREKELEQKIEKLSSLKETSEQAKKAFENANEMYEKLALSIKETTKTLRLALKQGCTCPVCQQKVESIDFNETAISDVVEKAKKEMEDKKKENKSAEKEYLEMGASINALEEEIAKQEKRINNDNQLIAAQTDAKKKCAECGIEVIDEKTEKILETKENEVKKQLQDIKNQILEGQEIETKWKDAIKMVEKLQKKKEDTKKKEDKARDALESSKNEVENIKAQINQLEEDIKSLTDDLNSKTKNAQIGIQWDNDPKAFAKTISQRTKAYNNNKDEHAKEANRLQLHEENIKNVNDALNSIYNMKPEWVVIEADKSEEIPNLLMRINEVSNNTSTHLSKLKEALEKLETAIAEWNSFLDANNNFTEERLEKLSLTDKREIDDLRKTLQEIKSIAEGKAKIAQTRQEDLERHMTNCPNLDETDNVESLQAAIDNITKNIEDNNKRLGELQQQLKDDEENKSKKEKQKERLERIKVVYEQWKTLNDLIGTSDGKRFREIAQSYVLGALVNSANHYMQSLTDRYSMSVEPGTFIIMLQDAYQGYTRRPATTISGGESFLVSLSLALAMSDIAQNLSVDTLFIDEGFGSLSGEPLQKAITTLKTLHNTNGKHVGIISHVEELREKIPVQIKVKQNAGSSASSIEVTQGL